MFLITVSHEPLEGKLKICVLPIIRTINSYANKLANINSMARENNLFCLVSSTTKKGNFGGFGFWKKRMMKYSQKSRLSSILKKNNL
jgi:hypothetical protein